MGDEKLDNAVYTIRGLYDLADMARVQGRRGDGRVGAQPRRATCATASRPRGGTRPASSTPTRWRIPATSRTSRSTGSASTPMEAELTIDERAVARPRDRPTHGTTALAGREDPCYSGERAVQPRPVPHRLRRRPGGQGRAHDLRAQHRDPGRRRGQLRPARRRPAEALHRRRGRADVRRALHAAATRCTTPRARRTSSPAPRRRSSRLRTSTPRAPRDANVERCTRCRSMVMQAWNQYGTMWPVVHQQLGVRPDLGRGALEVVPQLPSSAADRRPATSGSATGALKLVRASRDGNRYTTTVDTGSRRSTRSAIGHTLPRGSHVGPRHARRRERATGSERETNRGARGHGEDAAGAPHAGGHGGLNRPSQDRSRAPSALRRSTPARGWRAGPARRRPRP